MSTPRVFFEDFLPQTLGAIGVSLPAGTTVAFHVEGEEGGDWQIVRTSRDTRVSNVDQAPKDCEMWCDCETFHSRESLVAIEIGRAHTRA